MKYKLKIAALIIYAALSHVAPLMAFAPLALFPLTEVNALLTAFLVGLSVGHLAWLHLKLG